MNAVVCVQDNYTPGHGPVGVYWGGVRYVCEDVRILIRNSAGPYPMLITVSMYRLVLSKKQKTSRNLTLGLITCLVFQSRHLDAFTKIGDFR